MGCASSDLSNMSDCSSEENSPPPSTVPIVIEKKTLNDNMIPNVKAHSVSLTNLLFDTNDKWNHHIEKSDQLFQQIENMLTTYLLQQKYYIVEFDRELYHYKPVITRTELCEIILNLNNYGACVCNASANTCSCLTGICSLLNMHLNLTTNSIREYSNTYIHPKLKCLSDHTIQINLIESRQIVPTVLTNSTNSTVNMAIIESNET
jgi:hypothetical protein